jgi:hypothetical protein
MTIEQRDNGRWYDCVTHIDVTDFLTNLFRLRAAHQRGGKSKSEAKRRAARLNGAKHVGKKAAQCSKTTAC